MLLRVELVCDDCEEEMEWLFRGRDKSHVPQEAYPCEWCQNGTARIKEIKRVKPLAWSTDCDRPTLWGWYSGPYAIARAEFKRRST